MANRNFNWRPNWLTATLGAAIGMVIASTLVLAPREAQAVHDEPTTFQIEGNAQRSVGGGNPPVSLADDDWDNVFGLTLPYPTPRAVPTETDTDVFIPDGANLPGGKESSAWSGSNKDIDEINDGLPGTDNWEYGNSKVTPDKDNITNAYARADHVDGFPGGDLPGHPAGIHSHLVIYFGADRFADDGDAAMGFWFFRGDVGTGANGQFEGKHSIGDVLIQVDFRGQGDNEIEVFEWVGTGGNVGNGVLQRVVQGLSSSTEICTPDDTACVTTNDGLLAIPSPWSYTGKNIKGNAVVNEFPRRVFIEGGIDIGALFGEVCFSSYMAETRSSHSETAELKDFALDDFDLCSIDLVDKVCSDASFDYDSGTDGLYTTTHTVEIKNDGAGPLYDVSILDTPAGGIGGATQCNITAISGGSGYPTLPAIVTGDWQEVANNLAPDETVLVTMLCLSSANPLVNSVDVRAGAAPGDTSVEDDAVTESGEDVEACLVTLNPILTLTKHCQGDENSPLFQTGDLSVILDPEDGFKPDVCVDVTVTNFVDTGETPQRVTLTSFTDTEMANDLPPGATVSIMDKFLAANGGSNRLDPNQTVEFSYCYKPDAPDGEETNPGLVTYTDKVRVEGDGQASGSAFAEATATCRLCPTCPDCNEGS